MDLDRVFDVRVRPFVASMPLTMERHELSLFADGDGAADPEVARVIERRRLEAVLKSVFVQVARAMGDSPVRVELTYDPLSSPERPVYGPLFGPPRA